MMQMYKMQVCGLTCSLNGAYAGGERKVQGGMRYEEEEESEGEGSESEESASDDNPQQAHTGYVVSTSSLSLTLYCI